MSKLSIVSLALVAFVTGCTASSSNDASSNDSDFTGTHMQSYLERPLSPPIAVPTDTPIGRGMDAAAAEKVSGLTARPPQNVNADHEKCVTTTYVDAQGRAAAWRQQCKGEPGYTSSDILNVGGGKIIVADHDFDGRVDSFSDETGPLYEVDDDDRDGKVDRVIEAAARVPGLSISDYGDGWSLTDGGTIANRIREDKDKDGYFEVESITAKTPAMFKREVSEP